MSRFEETVRTIPPITLGTIALCCILYILQLVLDIRVTNWTLAPSLVVAQPYRIVSSALLHNGPLHLGMNMMSMYAIGMMVEKRLGSLRLLFTIVSSIGVTAAVHIGIAWVALVALKMSGPMDQHSIGFSGVLFHLSVLECNMGSHASRSLFGFVDVPAKVYPFALLFVLQMIMPNLSFLGHLSGILVGIAQVRGLIPLTPSEARLRDMDSSASCISSRPSFVPTTSIEFESTSSGCGESSIVERCKTMIFGRGDQVNANIRFGSTDDVSSWGQGQRLGGAEPFIEEKGGASQIV